jgi:hypothetical protein
MSIVNFKSAPAEVATPTVRDGLKAAHSALAAAQQALEASRAASERARAWLADVVRQAEDHEATEKHTVASIVDSLKNSIRGGNGPSIASEKSIAKSSAAHAEIEGRRSAALQVVEGLREEENEAERAVADAQKGVEFAVKAVLRAEAIAQAAAWKPLDAAARAARARLGRHHGPVSMLMTSSDTVAAAISENEKGEFDLAAIRDVDHAWNAFGAALLLDANAPLDFQQAEIAAAERAQEKANSKARIDAIFARMNTTA